jgi:hypothetical protein
MLLPFYTEDTQQMPLPFYTEDTQQMPLPFYTEDSQRTPLPFYAEDSREIVVNLLRPLQQRDPFSLSQCLTEQS